MPRRRRPSPFPFPVRFPRRGRRYGGWPRGRSSTGCAWVVTLAIFAAFLLAYANREPGRQREGDAIGGVVVPAANGQAPVVTSDREPSSHRGGSPEPRDVSPRLESSPHLTLGNPSQARADPSMRDNYLLVRPQYALSYNDRKATANWASWRLRASDLGNAPRLRTFLTDDSLPAGFYRVTHEDYTGSGFDRGHLVPHSDRDATPEDAASTYRMSNIIPQAPNVNQRSWAMLEMYSRQLVADGRNVLYIVAGPHGEGGVGTRGPATRIGRGRVTVPAENWKIVVVVPAAIADDPERFSAGLRVIAIRVANDDAVTTLEWSAFRTTPREIEDLTGYRFFDRLRPEVAEALRDRLDRVPVAPPPTPRWLR